MVDTISIFVGGVALLWTIYQQYRISKICQDCPYFPGNNKLEIEIVEKIKDKVTQELKRD